MLSEVRENENWEEWILYILRGIEITAKNNAVLIKGIKVLLEETIDRVKKELPSLYSKELVETLFEQPYCRVASLVNKGLFERRTAMKNLRELVLHKSQGDLCAKVFIKRKSLPRISLCVETVHEDNREVAPKLAPLGENLPCNDIQKSKAVLDFQE